MLNTNPTQDHNQPSLLLISNINNTTSEPLPQALAMDDLNKGTIITFSIRLNNKVCSPR
jgi:hypothetical protein